MTGVSFPIHPTSARQWFFVGFWVGLGLALGGAMALCIVSMILQVARLLLGALS